MVADLLTVKCASTTNKRTEPVLELMPIKITTIKFLQIPKLIL